LEQGTERGYLAELVDYWRTEYDWRRTESRVNAVPQLITEVEGQASHLLHARSDTAAAAPLLLIHGWPGSALEFLDVIGPLTADFDLVIPSLPGFTFGGNTRTRLIPAPHRSGIRRGMERLGYAGYGVQGGDWGSVVGANLVDMYPERIVGLHLNVVSAGPPVRGSAGARRRAERRGAANTRCDAALATYGRGLPRDPGYAAAVARLRPPGLAGRARGVDRREVP